MFFYLSKHYSVLSVFKPALGKFPLQSHLLSLQVTQKSLLLLMVYHKQTNFFLLSQLILTNPPL